MSDRLNATVPIIALALALAGLAVLGCRGVTRVSDPKAAEAPAPPNVIVVARGIPPMDATAPSRSETATLAARVNGYLGGNGTLEALRSRLDGLGLSVEGKGRLLDILSAFER